MAQTKETNEYNPGPGVAVYFGYLFLSIIHMVPAIHWWYFLLALPALLIDGLVGSDNV